MYDYDYGSVTTTTLNNSALSALFGGIMIFSSILSLIMIISFWKIFKKAGKPGWAILVPIYNIIVLLEIAELPVLYILLFFIPFANIYAVFKVCINIAKRFGKSTGFGVGMCLLSIIFVPLLAFSDNVEGTNSETNNNGNFDAMNVINNQAPDSNVTESVVGAPTIEIASDNPNVEPAKEEAVVEENKPLEEAPIVEPVQDVAPAADSNDSGEVTNPESPVEEEITSTPDVTPIVDNSLPNSNEISEPNTLESAPEVQPVVDGSIAEPQTINPSEVSEQPIVDNASSVTPEPIVNETVNEPVNAFNSKPVDATNELQPEVANTVEEKVDTAAPTKKVCKNCGAEMPDIVSICPSCGTDNE